jgi:hypothetical protein
VKASAGSTQSGSGSRRIAGPWSRKLGVDGTRPA